MATQLIADPSRAMEPATAHTILSGSLGLETPVRQQPVKADRDPKPREDIEHRRDHDVVDVRKVARDERQEADESNQWTDHKQRRDDAAT